MGAAVAIPAVISTVIMAVTMLVDKLRKPPAEPAPISNVVISRYVQPEEMESYFRFKQWEAYLRFKQDAKSSDKAKMKQLQKEKDEIQKLRDDFENRKKNSFLNYSPAVMEQVRNKAREKLGLDCINNYNLAITGQAGSGKSTLVNGFCQFPVGDSRAAKTDVKECTESIQNYVHSQLGHFVVWDCPGAGTTKHPAETYFDDKMLYVFDFLIVLFTERFKEIEANLIKAAIQCEIPVACVRNKANHDFEFKKKQATVPKGLSDVDRKSLEEEIKKKLISELRQDTVEKLKECGVTEVPNIFIINAWAFQYEQEETFEEAQLIEHVGTVVKARREMTGSSEK